MKTIFKAIALGLLTTPAFADNTSIIKTALKDVEPTIIADTCTPYQTCHIITDNRKNEIFKATTETGVLLQFYWTQAQRKHQTNQEVDLNKSIELDQFPALVFGSRG